MLVYWPGSNQYSVVTLTTYVDKRSLEKFTPQTQSKRNLRTPHQETWSIIPCTVVYKNIVTEQYYILKTSQQQSVRLVVRSAQYAPAPCKWTSAATQSGLVTLVFDLFDLGTGAECQP